MRGEINMEMDFLELEKTETSKLPKLTEMYNVELKDFDGNGNGNGAAKTQDVEAFIAGILHGFSY